MSARIIHSTLSDDPLWYKDAVIYQLHVRSFFDSNGDGIGDFHGLSQKLDYLEDLGISTIWLLPFYPSPLKDDGYDISTYTDIHPIYGSIDDFTDFLKKAHDRGIRVITELVINHTSDQHPWFKLARRSPKGSKQRNYYVWSDTPEKYKGVRIIFRDFESSNWTFDHVAKSYYWHRFYSHQPDLNFESAGVVKNVFRFLDFWMEKGVDGLRLDAVPYLYEQEGTSCENLPQTHTFLKKLRSHVDKRYKNRVLLAEANQWPEQVVAYFGNDDECQMALHFPIMPRLFMAIRMENNFPIIEILNQTPQISEKSQWAMFLRNHDELTLEMVTDRDRDYMYQVYARDRAMRINLGIRRRLAPLLENDRMRIELMNCLLFSMPGTPIIYYGDEIGMGDNVFLGDRNGIRTPMQWSADRNAGFSKANPQRLFLPINLDPEYHYEAVNVQTQQGNQNSLLWWMKHLISLRKKYKAFGRGTIKFINVKNHKIIAFIRHFEDETILVIANLSGSIQYTQLDISQYAGLHPLELFGQTELPVITKEPYLFIIGAYGFYWLKLQEKSAEVIVTKAHRTTPQLKLEGNWDDIIKNKNRHNLERILPDCLKTCPWFCPGDKRLERIEIIDSFRLPASKILFYIILLEIEYTNGYIEQYQLPVGLRTEKEIEEMMLKSECAVIAKFTSPKDEQLIMYDAVYDDKFLLTLLNFMAHKRNQKSTRGKFVTIGKNQFSISGISKIYVKNRSVQRMIFNFDDKYLLKMYRLLDPGVTPEYELSSYLTQKKFMHIMPVLTSLEYSVYNEENNVLGIIYDYVPNQGNMWKYTLDFLIKNYELAGKHALQIRNIPPVPNNFYDVMNTPPPEFVQEHFQIYLQQAALLAQRTAQFHAALAINADEPAFRPEPFTDFHKYAKYQTVYSLVKETMVLLNNNIAKLPENIRPQCQSLLEKEKEILNRFKAVRDSHFTGSRIRIHGDYSLFKVMYTGKDFLLTGFEGRCGYSLSERKNKTSPLSDIASMLRSIHYASYVSVFDIPKSGFPLDSEHIKPMQNLWAFWTSAAFLSSYLKHAANMPFMPNNENEIRTLLQTYILERAFYELQYELRNRPEWVPVPLVAILYIMNK